MDFVFKNSKKSNTMRIKDNFRKKLPISLSNSEKRQNLRLLESQ